MKFNLKYKNSITYNKLFFRIFLYATGSINKNLRNWYGMTVREGWGRGHYIQIKNNYLDYMCKKF